MPAMQLVGIDLPELAAPIAHSLVRQDDAALGHQLFDVTVAETEAKVQPGTVADNLGRKPMALIPVGYGSWIHAASMSHQTAAGKGLVNLTVPAEIPLAPAADTIECNGIRNSPCIHMALFNHHAHYDAAGNRYDDADRRKTIEWINPKFVLIS
jgi:hypothetical protein